ncbi:UPF0261 domain-containing protein [Delphinella strobiligena]|nr:UPF0261 domain-containing protein [Delphinella strobiligena]
MPHIIILGTLDTKLPEILYLHDQVTEALKECKSSLNMVTLIDCGRIPSPNNDLISVRQEDLIERWAPQDGRASKLPSMPRSEAIRFMAECATNCVKYIWNMGKENASMPHGILSAGGSGGTTLASTVMREAVPLGVPKFIASTIGSGDTGPIVGETDIAMMFSVVDIAGTNELLRTVLSNAACAVVGMAAGYERSLGVTKSDISHKTRVGITMFGVTTPCVDKIREHLEEKCSVEVFVFHATGHGGKAMERLVAEGRLDAILDITTTEICDYLMGGNMSAGPNRLEAALKAGIPNLISLGATDMVNFGPIRTVPERFQARNLLEHNPSVTLMRTTKEECHKIGVYIVDKIREHAARPDPVELVFPKGGVSLIAGPGGAFEDTAADNELRETIKRGLADSQVRIVEDDRDLNDAGFAIDVAERLMRLISLQEKAAIPQTG